MKLLFLILILFSSNNAAMAGGYLLKDDITASVLEKGPSTRRNSGGAGGFAIWNVERQDSREVQRRVRRQDVALIEEIPDTAPRGWWWNRQVKVRIFFYDGRQSEAYISERTLENDTESIEIGELPEPRSFHHPLCKQSKNRVVGGCSCFRP